MKTQVTNYTFDKTAKTITFTDYSEIRLDSILLITNVTDNIIVYNFADPLLGGTVAANVLTLTYDTSAMDDTDKLQIFYDDNAVQPSDVSNQEVLNSLVDTLNELNSRLMVLAGMANSGVPALRIIPAAATIPVSGSLTTAGTVSTVTSVTTLGTLTNIGALPATVVGNAENNILVQLANTANAVA